MCQTGPNIGRMASAWVLHMPTCAVARRVLPMNTLLRVRILTAGAVLLGLQAACARSVSSDGEPDPLLVAPNASNPDPLAACISTDCPPPWGSCGDGLCTTDTSSDPENCGGCGKACPHPTGALHATSVCADGKCVYACDAYSADCNHKSSDGCEVSTGDDPKNCGGCGLACKEGELCWKGACGCPPGFTRCGDECKNLGSDNDSCGVCDKKCDAPKNGDDPEWKCGPFVQPTNTAWACEGGGCKLACKEHFGDCNADLCADGCEMDLKNDPANCGACGRACAANQQCVEGQCLCPAGTTRCGNRCVDVNVDPDNCGGCGNICPGAGVTDNGSPTCNGGRCGYTCYAGFADCNNRLNDGCETNIGTDPRNCGGCGTKCDRDRGQPCVVGKCLTKPCGPAAGTQ